MKIGLFTDSHYCGAEVLCGTRRPSLSLGKIREAMDAFRDAGVDMCFCLGDITDHAPEDSREDVIGCFGEVMDLVRSYGIPFRLVTGNHDYLMMTAEDVARVSGSPLLPCVVTVGEYDFILLDANYRSDMRRFDEAGVEWTDSNLPPEQIAFLRDALEASEKKCVVMIHENLDPHVDGYHIVKNAAEARAIMAVSGKVERVIQGHYHPGAAHRVDGIDYLTLPAMCEGTENRFCILEL